MRLQGSNVFAGKHGFITPRDLFRWAGRGAVGYQQVRSESPLCRLGKHALADMQPKLASWSRPCCIVCCPAAEISLPPMQLAEDGYAVLAERLREPAERAMVADVLQKILNAQVPPRSDHVHCSIVERSGSKRLHVEVSVSPPQVGLVLLCTLHVTRASAVHEYVRQSFHRL